MTNFSSIQLRNWRQFDAVEIEFHPRLTVITGSNGAGKSTILNICSQHFGFSRPFLATPKKKKGGGYAYDLGFLSTTDLSNLLDDPFTEDDDEDEARIRDLADADVVPTHRVNYDSLYPPIAPGSFITVGSIKYSNGQHSDIGFHEQQTQAYGLQINSQQAVEGVPISSHRVVSPYQAVENLSLQLITAANAYSSFFSEYVQRLQGGNTQRSPIYRMKETLIAMAAFGEGNSHLERNAQLSTAFEGFGIILRKVLPKELGFQKLVVRVPDIIIKTRSGEFVIDASSGGVTAIIEIAWQVYLYSLSNESFVVTLDEPENHLHPTMQRTILSNLISAFPNVQFIVATHSPFIVSAVEDSKVYALKYMGAVGQSGFPVRGPRRVQSIALDEARKGGSAGEILREVLGVSVSMPDWAATKLQAIVEEFSKTEIVPATLKHLRARLSEAGFSEYYPDALERLVRNK